MLKPVYERRFEKDLALSIKRKKDIAKVKSIILMLCEKRTLPAKNRNHKLSGKYNDHWECHIEPDLLLIYQTTTTKLILARLGTHSDLF